MDPRKPTLERKCRTTLTPRKTFTCMYGGIIKIDIDDDDDDDDIDDDGY
jgi:hypothetical protein